MRWEDERYVKLYTRDTVDWLAMSFDAQALLLMLFRKVDRAGLLPLGKHGRKAVAIAVSHPELAERIDTALEELLADGCVTIESDVLMVPNFIEAQEARQSNKQRQAEMRARARDKAGLGDTDLSRGVTGCNAESHGSNTASHGITTRQDKTRLEEPPLPPKGGRRGKRKGWVDESTLTPEEGKLVAHWREVCRHPNASLIASELESLRQGIADCKVLAKEFGENEHRLAWRAITGLSLSEHHMANGYSDLRYAFKPENVRRFIEADKARADGRAMPVQKPAESFRERDLARIQAESEARPERRVVTEEQIEEVERMRAEAAASRERGAA